MTGLWSGMGIHAGQNVRGGASVRSEISPALFRKLSSTSAAPSPDPGQPPKVHGKNPKKNPQGGSIPFGVVQVPMRLTTGKQNIKIPGFGRPTGAIIICGNGSLITNPSNECLMSMGATDGTNQFALTTLAEHGKANADCYRRATTDEIVMMVGGSGVVFAEANFDSFIQNGIRINVTVTDGGGRAMNVLLFHDDVQVSVGASTLATEDNAATFTPGFEMDALFTFSLFTAFNDTSIGARTMVTGFGSWDGVTVRQTSLGTYSLDGAATGDPRAQTTELGVWVNPNDAGPVYAELGNITDTTFDLTSKAGNLSGVTLGYLALKLPGGQAWAGVLDSPASTGNFSWSQIGFKPNTAIIQPTLLQAEDTSVADGDAGAFGWSMFTEDVETCRSWADEDASTTTDTQSDVAATAIDIDLDDGAAGFVGSFLSFDTHGVTLNFSAVPGTARKWPALFFKT